MKAIAVVCALNVLFFVQSFCSVTASLEETCKNATRSKEFYEFCITSLQVVPESRTADIKGLASIAADLTMTNYTHTIAKVQGLQKKGGLSNSITMALSTCSDAYGVAIGYIQGSIAHIKTGDIKNAHINMIWANSAPDDCETAFDEFHNKSLLSTEDDFANRLSRLAINIIYLLLE
ncbi:cell wall / vacuolar inhibitor of fructosidase 2-like [Typha angustifolia]|uniref:cell wall / vacuolar inhibitor of fructosidase 2-like n=1 Tax=Typha angustifolia TaxID=59011 RepID=UPI003C2D7F15